VGASGSVVATDLDTEQFAAAAANHANLLVRTENVADGVAAHPDGRLFDIAHARLVIGHVRDHARAIANIVRAVRPGGRILIEDVDFLWLGLNEQPLYPERAMPVYFRVWKEVAKFLQLRGFDVHWGRRLAHALADAGLSEVAGEAVALIGSAQVTAAMRQTIARFGPEIVRLKRLSPEDLAACLQALEAPGTIFTGSPLFSVWGRRKVEDA
jgi:SAM-dependent methyltransferase